MKTTTPGALRCTSRGSATSLPVEVGRSGLACWHGPRRCGRRTTPIVHNVHYLGCVLLSDRWPRSSLRCRRRRSNRISYREARPSAPRHQQATRPWPGCPAPCSTKGVEADWRSGRLLTPANLDLLRGPIPFSSVWKSNFGRPTPSTRGCLHSCVCSMALRLTSGLTHCLISTQALVQCEKYVQETCPTLVSTNITSQRRPAPQSPRSPAQNAAQALRKRPSAKRAVPDRPKPVHLFAACAMGDPDLVEALVLRCSCLLYTSPSPRDATLSRMPSSA